MFQTLTCCRAIMVSAVLCLFALPVWAASITGNYQVAGRNPDGSAYNGLVQISENQGNVRMFWQVGGRRYQGTGVYQAPLVTVDWGSSAPIIYVVMSNGALHGTWANGTALERLTRY